MKILLLLISISILSSCSCEPKQLQSSRELSSDQKIEFLQNDWKVDKIKLNQKL